MPDLRFCFKLLPEAEWATDEHGNPAECYVQVKIGEAKQGPDFDYNQSHHNLIPAIAAQCRVKQEHVVPVSVEEYDREVEQE